MIEPVTYFLLLLKASLFSSGGLANLPSLHQDFLGRHWATEAAFAAALAIGQVAPGPTGLWVVAFGYLTFGLAGACLSAVAVVLPPLLALPLDRVHDRIANQPVVRGFRRGIVLAAAAAVPLVFLRVVGSHGFGLSTVAIVAASVALIGSRQVPVIAVLAMSGAAGVLVYS